MDGFKCQLGYLLGEFWVPRWGQVGTKWHLISIQKTIKKMIAICMASKSNFLDFWLQLGRSRGGPTNKFWKSFCALGTILGPRWPRDPPRGPKTPPKTDFLWIWDPNLMDFGLQLGGFWVPTRMILLLRACHEGAWPFATGT